MTGRTKLILIIGIVLLAGVISSIAHRSNDTGASSMKIIEINEQGFFPNEMTVTLGSTVIFKNTGKEPHWPASDAHPSHTEYPELDPKSALAPGESWSFMFDTAGVWRMHDHNFALERAVITVVGSTSAPMTLPCTEKDRSFACQEKRYTDMVREEGVTAAFTRLRSEQNNTLCHAITHVIGREASVLYPNIAEAYSKGDGLCASGYYHGVMEAIVDRIGKDKILGDINTICSTVEGHEVYGINYYNCVHGLGHGFMVLTENELFESLAYCDVLNGEWERLSCYGGVFMENVVADDRNHRTDYLKPEDPAYPCTAVESKYKVSCYQIQSSYALNVYRGDFTKVFTFCRNADAEHRSICFQSIGRDVAGANRGTTSNIKTFCDIGRDTFEKTQCMFGAVMDLLYHYHSSTEATHLCAAYEDTLNGVCEQTIEEHLSRFQ